MIFRTALVLFAIVGIIHLVFGIVYLTTSEFMSYHGQALNVEWKNFGENYKTLFLALIKLAGAGGLVAGIVNLVLVWHLFKQVESKFIWLLIIASFIFQFVMNFVVYTVYTKTPGDPPLVMVSIGSATLLIAIILLLAGRRG